MDPGQFDRATRRAVLAIGGTGLAVLFGLDGAAAKRRKKKKRITICLDAQTLKIPKKKRDQFLLIGAKLGACPPPSCTDGVLNNGETGVDCGGPCSPCPNGQPCQDGTDCLYGLCASDPDSTAGKTCAVCSDIGQPCGAGCQCLYNINGGGPYCVAMDGAVPCNSETGACPTDDMVCTIYPPGSKCRRRCAGT